MTPFAIAGVQMYVNALVVQSDGKTVGVINMHDLLRAGVI